ncbi:MAG: nucleotide-binding protein [Armatimonadetes bacterium]|nr:nucleotide-binding protein [Armatimonadota bacterium]
MGFDRGGVRERLPDPYREGRPLVTGGQTIDWANVHPILIFRTNVSLENINSPSRDPADSIDPDDFLSRYGLDVTVDFITHPPGKGVVQEDTGDAAPLPKPSEDVRDGLYYNLWVETEDDARRKWRTFALDLTREEAKDLVRMCVRQESVRFQEEWLVPCHDFKNIVLGEDERTSATIIAESKWPTAGRHPEPREWWVPNKCRRQVRNELWSEAISDMEPQMASNQITAIKGVDPRDVWVVYGRNEELRKAMFDFLRSLDLHPLEWEEVAQKTGNLSPYTGQVLEKAFGSIQAVVVLLTGDDMACLRHCFWNKDEPPYETEPTPQARPNVLFEAGMAFGTHPNRTVLVEIGRLRQFSNIGGRHTIRFDGSTEKRQALAKRLEMAGCQVNLNGTDWLTAGDFSEEDEAESGFTIYDTNSVRPRVVTVLQEMQESNQRIIAWDFVEALKESFPLWVVAGELRLMKRDGLIEWEAETVRPENTSEIRLKQ